MSRRIDTYVRELTRIFKTSSCKHDAHERSRPVLEDISADRDFITAILWQYLSTPDVLNATNYPTVEISIRLNADYHVLVNCWIPLPNRQTNVSSKTIHHHGNMLLTTIGIFGSGYDHWLFSKPEAIDPANELYAMQLVERKRHVLRDLAFVDAWVPHLPVYPGQLSLTLCLWSNQFPTTWRDHVKRIPVLKRHDKSLRRLAVRAGLAKPFDLKVVSYFDYYPTAKGFKGMQKRMEFPRGPNEDYLHSVFHVIQETGNDGFAPLIEQQLDRGTAAFANPQLIRQLLRDLRQGRPIEGRLSACHLNVPHATFTTETIERTLALLEQRRGSAPVPATSGVGNAG
jgi:hypothetical protein